MNGLILTSSLMSLVSPLIYARAIFQGKAKPHRTTRIVLLISTSLAAVSLFVQGDRVAVWLAGVATFQALFIFILSLKYGMGGWSKVDILCLVIALLGLLLWQILDNPSYSLYAAILADFTGVFPTLLKTYHLPKTENAAFFAIDTVAAFLNLLAVHDWTIAQVAFPFYLIIINLAVVILVYRKKLTLMLLH